MNIRNLLISIVLIGLFATIFGLYFANISTQYNQDYNDTAFEGYNQITNITQQTESIETGLQTDTTQEGITDLIGGFLKRGFAVIKITFQSFGLINNMGDAAIDQLDERTGGASLNIFKTALLGVIGIIFVFLIISVLVGRDI